MDVIEIGLDTFKDIWEPYAESKYKLAAGLDTFKDIWELVRPAFLLLLQAFRYLQGYMGTRSVSVASRVAGV